MISYIASVIVMLCSVILSFSALAFFGAGFFGPPQKSKMEGEVNIRICIIANILFLLLFIVASISTT